VGVTGSRGNLARAQVPVRAVPYEQRRKGKGRVRYSVRFTYGGTKAVGFYNRDLAKRFRLLLVGAYWVICKATCEIGFGSGSGNAKIPGQVFIVKRWQIALEPAKKEPRVIMGGEGEYYNRAVDTVNINK
jgi:hypothetical protein